MSDPEELDPSGPEFFSRDQASAEESLAALLQVIATCPTQGLWEMLERVLPEVGRQAADGLLDPQKAKESVLEAIHGRAWVVPLREKSTHDRVHDYLMRGVPVEGNGHSGNGHKAPPTDDLAVALRQVKDGADFYAVVFGLAPCILSGDLAEEVARSALCSAYGKADGEDLFSTALLEAKATPTDIPHLSQKDPLKSADAFVDLLHRENGQRLLHRFQGQFYRWVGTHYAILDEPIVRQQVWRFLPKGQLKPNSARVSNVLDAVEGECHLPETTRPPEWLSNRDPEYPDPSKMVALRSGLLNPDTGTLHPATPRLFYRFCLPFDYDPADAEPPVEWLKFLASIWDDDPQQIDCLQEMMGYFLTPDLSMEKMFLIHGPMRSGKGTITRVLTELLGLENVAAGSLDILSGDHGLQALADKSLFVDPDCMVRGGADIVRAVSEIKKISGQDPVIVNPKNRAPYTVLLRLHVLLCANEIPRFQDVSNALSSRFIVLRMTRSFLGDEDLSLKTRLMPELPRILHWALTGMRRLYERGYFLMPDSSKDLVAELEEQSSPIRAFIRDRCELGPHEIVNTDAIWAAWRKWCEEQGEREGAQAWFGRSLRAALPSIEHQRLTENGKRSRVYRGVGLRLDA